MRNVKRVVKTVFGFTLLTMGVVLLFTPIPGWLVILAGLALLGAEFLWARRLLDRLKGGAGRVLGVLRPSCKSPDLLSGWLLLPALLRARFVAGTGLEIARIHAMGGRFQIHLEGFPAPGLLDPGLNLVSR